MNKKNILLASVMGIGILGAAAYSIDVPSQVAEAKEVAHQRSTEIHTQQEQGAVRSKIVADYVEENHEAPTDEQLEDQTITPNQLIKNALETYSQNYAKEQGVNDEGYNMYLQAKTILSDLQVLQGQNVLSANTDIKNLFLLSAMVQHYQFARTSDIDPNGGAVDKVEYASQWKATSADMKQANEYIKEILNDLNVAENKGGKGKTYGVTHRLDGDKVNELEKFVEGHEGLVSFNGGN